MNRDIKFSAWDVDNKRMFNDCFSLVRSGTEEWVQFQRDSSKNLVWLQFTGCADTISGVPIKDSDIVRHEVKSEFLEKEDWITIVDEVKMINGCWCVGSSKYPLFGFENTIVGNIHQLKK